jgi:hypothetical protein
MWSHSFALKRERHDDVAILCIIDRDATYIHVCYLLWLLSQALKANVNVSFEHHFKMEICPAFDQVSGTSCIVCMVVCGFVATFTSSGGIPPVCFFRLHVSLFPTHTKVALA